MVLGGQHTCKALQVLRQEHVEAGTAIPSWLQTVVATVLRSDTPVECRRLLAGDHQYRQRMVSDVVLSRWCIALLNTDEGARMVDRITQATHVCGYPRYKTPVWNYAHLRVNLQFLFLPRPT